jgi:hypothetical protein
MQRCSCPCTSVFETSHGARSHLLSRTSAGVRRTQSTDSGLLRLMHAMRAAPGQRQGGSPAAALHAGDSLWELGDSLPLPHPDRCCVSWYNWPLELLTTLVKL